MRRIATNGKWHKKSIISSPEILKWFSILQKSQNSVYIWLLTHSLTVKVTRLLTNSCCFCSNLFDKFLTSLFRPQNGAEMVAGIVFRPRNGGSGNRIFWNDRFAFSLRFHPTVGRAASDPACQIITRSHCCHPSFLYADEGVTKSLDTTWECHFLLLDSIWVVVPLRHKRPADNPILPYYHTSDHIIIASCNETWFQKALGPSLWAFKVSTKRLKACKNITQGQRKQWLKRAEIGIIKRWIVGGGGKFGKPWKL